MLALVNDFDEAVLTANVVSNQAHQTDSSGHYVFDLEVRTLMTQAAFVHVFVAFEEFLEKSFAHYGMGGASLAANIPPCFANAPDVDHLHAMFIGRSIYMDWSTPDSVVKVARLYFVNGEPFATAMKANYQDLLDMKTVRNAASHVSRTTTDKAEGLHLRWTAKPLAGATAYDVLIAPNTSGVTFMSHSESVLRHAVAGVAYF